MALYVISDGLDSKTKPSIYASMKERRDFDALAFRFSSTSEKASIISRSMETAASSCRLESSVFVRFRPSIIRLFDISSIIPPLKPKP